MWNHPSPTKIYEALGAVADGRILVKVTLQNATHQAVINTMTSTTIQLQSDYVK